MSNEGLNNLVNGILITGFANIISNFSLFFLIVYLATVLDPAELGIISFVIASSTILITIGDFGISSALQKYVQDVPTDKKSDVIVSSLLLKFIISLIIGVIAFLLDYYINFFKGYGFYIALIVVCSSFGLVTIIYNAQLEFKKSRSIQILLTFSYIILAIILVYANLKITGPLIAKALSFVIVGLPISLYFLINSKFNISKETVSKIFQFGFLATLLTSFSIIFTQSDIILLTYIKGEEFAGIYKVAMTMASIPLMLGSVISTPLLPILSQQIRNNNLNEILKIHKVITRYVTFLAIPIFIGGAILAHPLIEFVFGAKYLAATTPFILLLFSQIFGLIVISMGSILLMNNKLSLLIRISFTTAFLNIIGNILLIPFYGMAGAAFSSLVTFILGFVLQFMWLERNMPLSWEYTRYFKFTISSLILGLFILFMLPYIVNKGMLISVIGVSTSIYVLIVLLFKGIELDELKKLSDFAIISMKSASK